MRYQHTVDRTGCDLSFGVYSVRYVYTVCVKGFLPCVCLVIGPFIIDTLQAGYFSLDLHFGVENVGASVGRVLVSVAL